jgi:Papain family cysteine protease
LIVGYVWKKYWVFQNSWGTDGGDEGFGTFQWEQLLDPNLAFDHLTLRNTQAAI